VTAINLSKYFINTDRINETQQDKKLSEDRHEAYRGGKGIASLVLKLKTG
jgi:hypothetical protein